MKLKYTYLLVFLFCISTKGFSKKVAPKKVEITIKNSPPSIASIPDQIMLTGGTFPELDLNDYLTEPDGDDVEWSYFFKNNLSNGASVDWSVTSNPQMTIIAKVEIREEYPTPGGDRLAAFHDGELIGHTVAKEIIPNSNLWVFLMNVESDSNGDSITFKYFDDDQATVFDVQDTLVYYAGQTIGLASNPYVLTAGFISVLDEGMTNLGVLNPKAYDENWVGVDTVFMVVKETGIPKPLSDTAMVIFRSSNSLPLELLSFLGNGMEEMAYLEWQIANPENVSGYEIQHSPFVHTFGGDPDWLAIGFVSHSDERLQYGFLDRYPNADLNYYRLKMIDLDGTFTFSPIISLNFVEKRDDNLIVFPNPIYAHQSLNIFFKTDSPTELEVAFVDKMGRLLKQQKIFAEDFQREFTLGIESLPPGFIIVKIRVGERLYFRPIILVGE